MRRTTGTKWLRIAWLFPFAGVVSFMALLSTAGAAEQAAGRAPRVAVVDMSKLLRSSSEWQDRMEERTRLLDNMKGTLSKLSRKWQTLRNEYENLPPGTEERQKKAAEIEQALGELERERRDFEVRISMQYNEAVRAIFNKLNAAVSAYAREHDIDLVLKQQSLPPAGSESPEQGLLIATAGVLYASPSLDISDAVAEKLNSEYAAPMQVK